MTRQRHANTEHQRTSLPHTSTAGPAVSEHPLLALQRLVGNAAVGSMLGAPSHGPPGRIPGERSSGPLPLPLQRQLKVDGDQRDVAAMAAMLGAASGLILVWDAKKKTISVKGPHGKKVLSQEVADQLEQIISDTAKDAEIHLGKTQEGVFIGAFPTDFKTNPVQELRIDQILSLEKGAPGSGVSTLMHEIIENYEMHSHRKESFDDAFEASHRPALKVENKILDQIQDARGESRSGGALNQYTVDVDLIPAKAPKATARNKAASTGKILFIEVHENDYLIFERNIKTGSKQLPRRVSSVSDGIFPITGFTAASTDVPDSAKPTITQISDLLTKDPTASVVLRVLSVKESATAAPKWGYRVQEAIRAQIENVIVASDSRFHWNDVLVGTRNTVEVVISHPKL